MSIWFFDFVLTNTMERVQRCELGAEQWRVVMGQQQLLLTVLGTIVVGLAIAVGITLFHGNSIESNKLAMISDLQLIGADARKYFAKPASLGGGGNSFLTYTIPTRLAETENGQYTCTCSAIRVFLRGASSENPANTIQVTVQRYDHGEGYLINWVYGGDFEN